MYIRTTNMRTCSKCTYVVVAAAVVNYVIWTVAVLAASAPCCQCSQGVGRVCSKIVLTVFELVLFREL
jgi:hypothetical protein